MMTELFCKPIERIPALWPFRPQMKMVLEQMIADKHLLESDLQVITAHVSGQDAINQIYRLLQSRDMNDYSIFQGPDHWAAFVAKCFEHNCSEVFDESFQMPPRITVPPATKKLVYDLSDRTKLVLREFCMPVIEIVQSDISEPRHSHWQIGALHLPRLAIDNDDIASILVCYNSSTNKIKTQKLKAMSTEYVQKAVLIWILATSKLPEYICVSDGLLYSMVKPIAAHRGVEVINFDKELPLHTVITTLGLKVGLSTQSNLRYIDQVGTFTQQLNNDLPARDGKAGSIVITACQLKVLHSIVPTILAQPAGSRYVSSLGPEDTPLYRHGRFSLEDQRMAEEVRRSQKITLNDPRPTTYGPIAFTDGIIISTEIDNELPMQQMAADAEGICLPRNLLADFDGNAPMGKVQFSICKRGLMSEPCVELTMAELLALDGQFEHFVKMLELLPDIPAPKMSQADQSIVPICVSEDGYQQTLAEMQSCFGQFISFIYGILNHETCFGCKENKNSQKHHECMFPARERMPLVAFKIIEYLRTEQAYQAFGQIFSISSDQRLLSKAYAMERSYHSLIDSVASCDFYRYLTYHQQFNFPRTNDAINLIMKDAKLF